MYAVEGNRMREFIGEAQLGDRCSFAIMDFPSALLVLLPPQIAADGTDVICIL